ncbi:MAG TPA: sialidase family protein, partial [Pyrinomonadaceae bacterium]|nr:sialidase family protein [Pyrinomonadaceae bacterium]
MKLLILILFAISIFSGCRTASIEVVKPIDSAAAQPEATRLSDSRIDAAEPAVAVDPAGNTFVAFVEHLPDKSANLFVKKLDAQLKPAGDAVRVNPYAGEVKAWAGDPPTLAIGPDGAVYVGWTRRVSSSELGNDLVISVSQDGGATFGDPVKVNDDAKPASHGMHSLAIGKEGHVYIAWLDERNVKVENHDEPAGHSDEMVEPNSEVFFAVSNDGGKTFGANQKIAADVCPCCKTSMALSSEGILYVSWRQVLKGDLRHIAVASSTDNGKTFSQGSIVSDDQWQLNACPVSGAALLAGENKTLQVLWYTAGKAGQAGIYSAESSDGGRTFTPRKLISGEGASGLPWLGAGSEVFPVGGGNIAIKS